MKKRLFRIYKNIFKLNLKSIIFNLTYFDFFTAIKFPILLHRKTKILLKKGSIKLPEKVTFGMIKFGYGGAIFDLKDKKSIWQLEGKIIFEGDASFGNGTTISVLRKSTLKIGGKFSMGSSCKILTRNSIEIGDNCLFSWNITLMDTDFHRIVNNRDVIINKPTPIKINNNVWVGCHSTILKGTEISENSIVAAHTVISKSEKEENVIIASNKQQIIKKNIKWLA